MYFLTLMSFALNRSELFSQQVLYYHTDSRNPGGRGVPNFIYTSNRYSPKSHTAVKKITSKAIRKASQSHRSVGFSANSAAVASVLAISSGVSNGSSSSSVINRNNVLAHSLERKIAKGSDTERRNALSVSLVCSRKNPGCSISDAAKRNAIHSNPGPNRRDSSRVGSNVKLNSTTTIKIKTTVVVSNSRERNSVRSSLPSSTEVLENRLIYALAKVRIERRLPPFCVSATMVPASRRIPRVASAEISDSPCRLIKIVEPAPWKRHNVSANQLAPC